MRCALIRVCVCDFSDVFPVWTVHEQVCVAALDCGEQETAEVPAMVNDLIAFDVVFLQHSLEMLKKRFPGSMRVFKLEGMFFEAEGEFGKAIDLYESVLKDHPTNAELMKRKISVLKAQGKMTEAIAQLNELLKV